MLAGLQTSYKPAAAGSRYWSSQDRDANLQFAAAKQHLTLTWFVLPREWSVIGQWGGRAVPKSHEGQLICHQKRTRKWCCGLIAAALDKPPVQVLVAMIGSLGPLQPVVGAARMKREGGL